MPPTPIAPPGGVRRFDPLRPVPDAILTEVLERATHSPSPFHLQPWRFVVVREERNRRRLQECAYRLPLLLEAPVAVIVLGYQYPHRSHLEAMLERDVALGTTSQAGAAELRARATRAMERTADLVHWSTRWSMVAAGLLIAAAESLGLASAAVDQLEPEKVEEAFGVPDDHTVCAVIALGFAAGEPHAYGRFGSVEVCYAEHFGQPWALGEAE